MNLPDGITGVFSVTPTQRGMLLGLDAARGQSVYLVHIVCPLSGSLDAAAFEGAWSRVARRHAALRTGFGWNDKGNAFQFVRTHVDLPIEFLNDGRSVEAHLAQISARDFDLTAPPLMRVAVIVRGSDSADLVWSHHHAIIDGWSAAIVLQEVMECYRAECQGNEPVLPPAVPFSNFVRWLGQHDFGPDAAFWQTQLGDFSEKVPIGKPDSRTSSGAGYGVKAWKSDLALAVRVAARRRKMTAAALVQAGWAMTLAHFSGRRDIVFGVTASGRPAALADCDRIVGPFLVTHPLRVAIDPLADVEAWLAQSARRIRQVAEHEQADPLVIRRAAAVPLGQPLFESSVVVQNFPVQAPQLHAEGVVLDLAETRVEGGQGSYPLMLMASVGEVLNFRFIYSLARFDERELAALTESFEIALAGLCQIGPSTLDDILGAMPQATRGVWLAAPPADFVAPTGQFEMQVAKAWSEIFKRPIGRHDGFLDCGGNSILALELATTLSRALAVEIPLKWIFEEGTVARIAARLQDSPTTVRSATELIPDRANRHLPYPLTEVQRAYWVGRGTGFELGGIGSFCLLEIQIGKIPLDVLDRAWNRLLTLHPMLRAELTPDGQQRVRPSVPRMPVDYRDFSSLSGSDLERARHELRSELRRRVDDPTSWPLFALCCSDVSSGERRLHVAYDPIICDAGSIRLLANELAILVADPDADLVEPALDFRDYVLALNGLRETSEGERARRYWDQRLDSLPAAPDLPLTVASPAGRFVRRRLSLAPEAWSRLKTGCQGAHITPSALVMALYAAVIASWSRTRRFTLNITLFNRVPLHRDVTHLVGDFTSLTLLEVDARQRQSLVELAQDMHRQLLNDLDHRLVDGVEVMRRLSSRASGGQIVMPVVFTSTLGQTAFDSGTAPIGNLIEGYGQTPQVYLDCQVGEWAGALHCWWDCLDECLLPGVASEMFRAFEGLLKQVAGDPAIAQLALPPLIPAVGIATRGKLNETGSIVLGETLDQLFLRSVASAPEAPAVITPDVVLSYRELDRLSAALAMRIAEEKDDTAELVAIIARRGCCQAIGSMGILRAGKGFTRIDPDWPEERRAVALVAAGVKTVLVENGVEFSLPAGLSRIAIDPKSVAPAKGRPVGASAAATAYVMFTSGSTGVPKGVTISHRAAVNTISDINRRLGVNSRDRVLAVSAATFDLSIYDLFGMLAAGGAVVCIEPTQWRDPAAWLAAVDAHGVTIWNSTPALMEMLTEQAVAAGRGISPSLRSVMLSGDWIPLTLPGRIRQLAPQADCIGLGGATEAAIWSVWQPLDRIEPGWPSYPYGAPLANQTTHVLDELLDPCPDWVAGMLYIGGLGLATGYWGRPDLTDAAFVTHPTSGERLYKTGDLARFRPGGQLELLGRQDGQVKIRGHRIELGEIETALGRHPDIAATAAIVDRRNVFAYCVAKPDRRHTTANALRQHLSTLLPAYMVPQQIRIIDALPLTSNGKIDRKALSDIADEPEPAIQNLWAVGELAEIVASAAAELLGIRQLQTNEDFFEAGGDSISATQLLSRLSLLTERQITLPRLFETRTPHAIAQALTFEGAEFATRIPRLLGTTRFLASTAQQRLWLLDHLKPGDPRYVIAGSLELRGSLDIAALTAAVSDLFGRHEPLRTSLAEVDGELVQILHETPGAPLPVVESDGSDDGLVRAFHAFASTPFVLSEEVPARFRLLRIAPDRSVLQFCIHHVACDAWSFGVMADELSCLYAFRRGTARPLESLALRYVDYAAWERQRLRTDALSEARGWWSTALSGLGPQRISTTRGAGEEHTKFPVALDASVTRRLRTCAERAGATLYTVLLAVFAAVLRGYGGREDMAIASSVTGRTHREIEGLIGCFINLILIRIDLTGAPSLDGLIARLHGFVAGALARQELPFEEIAAAARSRERSDDPPYAAVFVLQNTPRRQILLDGIEVTMPEHELGLSRYTLHLHLTEQDGQLRGALRTDSAAIGRVLGEELAGAFLQLCELAGTEPAAPLSGLLDRIRDREGRRFENQKRLNRMRSVSIRPQREVSVDD